MDSLSRRSVTLLVSGTPIDGRLTVPQNADGIVVFAAGGTASHHATLETELSRQLHTHGIATLVMELVSPADCDDRTTRSDLETLTDRLDAQLSWLDGIDSLRDLPRGLCGVDTGAAATLECLRRRPDAISGVALLNGRVDIATVEPASLSEPLLVVLDDPPEGLEEANRHVYERAGVSDSDKQFLYATSPFGVVAHWFHSVLSTDCDSLVAG